MGQEGPPIGALSQSLGVTSEVSSRLGRGQGGGKRSGLCKRAACTKAGEHEAALLGLEHSRNKTGWGLHGRQGLEEAFRAVFWNLAFIRIMEGSYLSKVICLLPRGWNVLEHGG